MNGRIEFEPGGILLAIVAVFASWSLALPLQLNATNTCSGSQGNNAIYNATCNNGNLGVTGSPAFIDASMFGAHNTDICAVLHGILASIPAVGAVIDARGLPSTGTNMTCTGTPWSGITNPPPSTILLPAGTIVIPATWILPTGTHLVGVGDSIGTGTTIQATTAFASTAGPMIAFCSSACMGVSVERLNLDGLGGSINGIVNQFAGEASFVDHVSLYQIRGTGLRAWNRHSPNYATSRFLSEFSWGEPSASSSRRARVATTPFSSTTVSDCAQLSQSQKCSILWMGEPLLSAEAVPASMLKILPSCR